MLCFTWLEQRAGVQLHRAGGTISAAPVSTLHLHWAFKGNQIGRLSFFPLLVCSVKVAFLAQIS